MADLRQLAIQLSTIHREWCRQNLEAWKTAQEAIRAIPDHPNHVPEDIAKNKGGSVPINDERASLDRDLPPVPDSPSTPATVPASASTKSPEMPSSPFKSTDASPGVSQKSSEASAADKMEGLSLRDEDQAKPTESSDSSHGPLGPL